MSMKEFFIHIGTVTIGILIALSLEGLMEWNHHRHMVREARENIRAEIEDNQRELAGHLTQASKNRAEQQNILKWIGDLEKTHTTSIHELSISFNLADLRHTSWTTAQTVGSLSLMNYAEVKRDAAVYELQDEFLRLQTRAEDAAIEAMIMFGDRPGDPSKASASELKEETSRIYASLTALRAQEQMGAQLQKRYRALLDGH